jgi:protein-L-isoaspartate(D-aspartate) O-methyltransferase
MTQDGAGNGERRARMVDEQLVRRGIRDENVLAAMRSVPRHLFVPAALAGEAYLDTPLPIGLGQTISQPYMVALMTELLGVNVRSRVLEVGSGSGYQTAVLAEVAGEVYALERLAELAERARGTLARLAYANAHIAIADGTRGRPDLAPFDAVLVAAAAVDAPLLLLRQLAEGGRLVVPIGQPQRDQVLTVLERRGDGFVQRLHTRCRFVPLVSDRDTDVRRGGEAAPGVSPLTDGWTDPGATTEERMMKAVDVRAHGTVQGVYYRAAARAEGARLGLHGWVRNMSDGTVALRLQGDPAVVDVMLGWCRLGPPAARVEWLDVSDAAPDDTLNDFEVR